MKHCLWLAQTAFLIQRQNPYCDTPPIPHMSNLHQILQETQPQHAHFAADAHNIFKCKAQGKHVISGLRRGKTAQVKKVTHCICGPKTTEWIKMAFRIKTLEPDPLPMTQYSSLGFGCLFTCYIKMKGCSYLPGKVGHPNSTLRRYWDRVISCSQTYKLFSVLKSTRTVF